MGKPEDLSCLRCAASPKSKRQRTWASESRCWLRWKFRASSLVVGVYMTGLTWMLGSKNISAEGGPERRLYGP